MFATLENLESLRARSGIYKITLRGTNRHYIGQSRNLLKRARAHCAEARYHAGDGCALHLAIRKYGEECFEFSVLCLCDPANLDELELLFIRKFKSMVPNGFNVGTLPGSPHQGRKTPDAVREKIRKANTGKKRSPETIARMREAALKKPPISEATRQKMRDFQSSRKRSDAWKRKMSEIMKSRKPKWEIGKGAKVQRKAVEQIDRKTGGVIAVFPSVAEAARSVFGHDGNLTSALKGRLKSHRGYAWRYATHAAN